MTIDSCRSSPPSLAGIFPGFGEFIPVNGGFGAGLGFWAGALRKGLEKVDRINAIMAEAENGNGSSCSAGEIRECV